MKIIDQLTVPMLYNALTRLVKSARRVLEVDVFNSNGYRLASSVYSGKCFPAVDVSLMDGYAVRRVDVDSALGREGAARLRIARGVDPRNAGDYSIGEGEAVYVETGFPVPNGSDAVIPLEDVVVSNGYVIVSKPPSHSNIAFRCSDYSVGELVAGEGVVVTSSLVKIMVEAGIGRVRVYDKPRVSIYSVGDEFVTGGRKPSNWVFVKGVVEAYGGLPEYRGVLPDDEGIIRESITSDESDIIVLIGGTGKGLRDKTWNILRELEAVFAWRRILVYPGRNTMGAVLDKKVIIGTPGITTGVFGALFTLIAPLTSYLAGGSLGLNVHPYIYAWIEKSSCRRVGNSYWVICRGIVSETDKGFVASIEWIPRYSVKTLNPCYRYCVLKNNDAYSGLVKLYQLLN